MASTAQLAIAAALNEIARLPIYLVDFCDAAVVCPDVNGRRFLHAGPSLDLRDITAPMRGALIAGLLYEGEAATPDEAQRIVDRRELEIIPCHAVGAVGALAGVVTPRTPVVVVERADGRRAFSPLNEGPGRAVRTGNFDPETLGKLRWLSEVLAPACRTAVQRTERLDVLDLQAEGVRRGDECHNRNVASTAALVTRLGPALVEAAPSQTVASDVLSEIGNNTQFFISISIAAAKALTDAIQASPVRGIVTAIAANGHQMGIRVSGAPSAWYVADAPIGENIQLVEGYTRADAHPLLGDSGIAETIGLGGCALSAAPMLARRLGSSADGARALVDEMRQICVAESERFLMPHEDLRGTPFGFSVEAVVSTGITPAMSGGYIHRELGKGRVGSGIIRIPLLPFELAAEDLTRAERPA